MNPHRVHRVSTVKVAYSTEDLPSQKRESFCSGRKFSYPTIVCVCSFIPYLKECIDLENTDMEWVNTAREYPDLLTFHGPEAMGFEYFGATDVAVALRSAVRSVRRWVTPSVPVSWLAAHL